MKNDTPRRRSSPRSAASGSAASAPPKKKAVPARAPAEGLDPTRTSYRPDRFAQAILDNLRFVQGKLPELATPNDWYMALAYTVRDRLLDRWLYSVQTILRRDVKVVSYLSAEFLMGPHLGNNLVSLGLEDTARKAVASMGLDLDTLMALEEEPGLGNGGLGRLAACFMDSLATLEIPAIGYGIRYEFGIFDQEIRDGWQVEITDKWLRFGNPWEIVRTEVSLPVKFGGRTEAYTDPSGRYRVRWVPDRTVKGIPYDTPVAGYGVNTVNFLRLWKAEACESFDFRSFNVGDYHGAVEEKVRSETISKILYPNDDPLQGKQLRLAQQYFFVSCSLQDMIRLHLGAGNDLDSFPKWWAVQLNDTHPAVAVAEMMRLLVDEHGMEWDRAWDLTRKTLGYTNHTLLPEALEKWPLRLFAGLLPRHLEIVLEINRRFLDEVRAAFPDDPDRVARMSLIDESGERYVRMAHLACVGSHSINGVAALHTDLLGRTILRDFHDLWPGKFSNKTNGVTPRRFLVLSNPRLSSLIRSRIGDAWIRELRQLRSLEGFVDDASFRREWRRAKRENKADLASLILKRTGITVDPDSLFDIQAKRIHEYKRQHLNALHILTLYQRIKRDPGAEITPRTFIFGGKAAPGYFMAKLMIKLVNALGDTINADPDVRDRIKVVFFPDFNVKNAQPIYPAADLSEQISTAGLEASGTGNMKFAMNGALTIGTLDGANVEIREEVGPENFFLFGLRAGEVLDVKARGYRPRDHYESNPALKEAIDALVSGAFSGGHTGLFRPLVDSLLDHDPFMVLADYQAYLECQNEAGAVFRDADRWTRMSILNAARMGKFSSDRSIAEYAGEIWSARAIPVEMPEKQV